MNIKWTGTSTQSGKPKKAKTQTKLGWVRLGCSLSINDLAPGVMIQALSRRKSRLHSRLTGLYNPYTFRHIVSQIHIPPPSRPPSFTAILKVFRDSQSRPRTHHVFDV